MQPLFSTSDLFDTLGDSCESCETQFRQYGLCTVFSGKIRTVKCLGDNVLLRRLLETKSEGEALVVDGSGYLGSALMGSTLAELGLNNGWAGAVIFGAIRDANALLTLNFGIKTWGSNPRKSEKHGARPSRRRRVLRRCNFCPGPLDLQRWRRSTGVRPTSNLIARSA
jgi:regulator of ribonuclease activity A